MILTKEQIQHIANLARLDLVDGELEVYGTQLSDILNYIEQLQKVDVAGTEPTAQITGLEDVLREDAIINWDKNELETALKQAPDLQDRQIKVRRVL